MWAAILPVLGAFFQIVLAIVSHTFSNEDKKDQNMTAALTDLKAASQKGDYDAFYDALSRVHSVART